MTRPPLRSGGGGHLLLLCLFVFLMSNMLVVTAKNMNNGRYEISNGKGNKYSADFSARTEFFEVYSPPIRSTYGQVYWAEMDPVALPDEIVQRFTGTKVMAIVGYEVDQVRRVKGVDIPIPITHAYNHHYIAALTDDRQGTMVHRPVPPELQHLAAGMTHGTNLLWDFQYHHPQTKNNMSSQVFSEGNGGEMRLSYHGYPPRYAQLIQSPTTWHINPMQIDTYNREYPNSAQFIPGPLPKTSPVYQNPSVPYSGLLECPCSDRIEKKIWFSYKILSTSTCPADNQIQNATECFQAGQFVIPSAHIQTRILVDNPTVPFGCTVLQKQQSTRHNHDQFLLVLEITWNEKKEDYDSSKNHYKNIDDTDTAAATTIEQQRQNHRQEVVAFASGVINATVTLTSLSSAAATTDDNNNNKTTTGTATITLVGPANVWFGIGFGSTTMCRAKMQGDECPSTGPYAILVYPNDNNDSNATMSTVEERELDYHGKGNVLSPHNNNNNSTPKTLIVMSNRVQGDHRIVVLQRPLVGRDERYFSFDMPTTTNDDDDESSSSSSLDIILATGCHPTLAQHCGHGVSQLNFMATNTPMTVCRDGMQATIGGRHFDQQHRCPPFPASTLLEQHNPTCSVHTYQGGLHCCHHMQSLLDQDQETPWPDQVLEYHLKFRYYFEEYTPPPTTTTTKATTFRASHQNLVRFYWQTEYNAGEYDIVPCPPGTPNNQCIQVITSRWLVKQMMSGCDGPWCSGIHSDQAHGIEIIYAGPHCHAPSCLSMELYNADTGELLCHVQPKVGQSTDKVYDELGFLAIPPCLWGNPEDGLTAPVFLSASTTLMSIKRNNNTLAHFGEMASWQMRGVVIMNKEDHDHDTGDGDDNKKNDNDDGDEVNNNNKEEERAMAVNDKIQMGEMDDLAIDGQMTEPRTSVRRGRPEV